MDDNFTLKVALATPLRKTFDYLPPLDVIPSELKVGIRIKVPFGKREVIGILIETGHKSTIAKEKLKRALAVLDTEPLFTSEILSLYLFASNYYQHPFGEVIFSSLPPLLRDGGNTNSPQSISFVLTTSGAGINLETLKHAKHQQKIMSLLLQHPNGLSREELSAASADTKALTALLAKGMIRKQVSTEIKTTAAKPSTDTLTLNDHQKQAIAAINSHQGFGTFLLEGVTGSGKTEVYMQCISDVLKKNKQALILIPEIGLTPQTVARFQSRFSLPISILHSNLNDRERCNAWMSALKGQARIIIGTRSAVLTPLPELGIIILDEEHDTSFKQQSGFRYSAKDLAIMRGKLEQVMVVLGSATPSLESLYNVKCKRFVHLRLPERAGGSVSPGFHVIDVRKENLREGLSTTILKKMAEHLERQEQVLVFLNRRGFAPTLLCHHCGWTAKCTRCDARMTYHLQLEKMICHHCSSMRPIFKRCSECQSGDLLLLGLGTQRLEQVLQQQFADVPVIRIDRDSTRRKGSMEQKIASINTGSPQILLGTQMLAKGHHFPNVTMVAIIDLDSALFSADFRASERLGQLIVQVAGRAGRENKPGEVYLQTHHPEHPLLAQLLKSGYSNFASLLLTERKSAELPPFSHLAIFRAESTQMVLAENFLKEVKDLLLQDKESLQVYGPIPALMEKKAGKYRSQLLVQGKLRHNFQKSLHPKIAQIESLPSGRKVRWILDIDPIELF